MACVSERYRRRWKPWTAPRDGTDYISWLPLELRARIASFLPFRQVSQMSTLSRPWRHIHDHTPVVKLKLNDFLFITEEMLYADDVLLVFLDEEALAGLEAALLRRAEGPESSKVDTLRLSYSPGDIRIKRHADRIIRLADAREICIKVPNSGRESRTAWALDLPPSTRDLDVEAFIHLAPAISGPGVAALETLCLTHVTIREWPPHLPALHSLTLLCTAVETPFPQDAWCPRLEYLGILKSDMNLARVDIRLPLLKTLELDLVYVVPPEGSGKSLGDVIVDAPELETLVVYAETGSTPDYRSFTARAPRLRRLSWRRQFTERVGIHCGRPSSVTLGSIEFTWNAEFYCRKMKECQDLMKQMLQGLLPELPSDGVVEAVRPYTTLHKYTVEDHDGKYAEEKLTCDLAALMSSLQVKRARD